MQVELWCKQGYRLQKVLTDAYSTRVEHDERGERTFTFRYPYNADDYKWIKYRKIVRIADEALEHVHSNIAGSVSDPDITLVDASAFDLLDYVLVSEEDLYDKSYRTTSAITGGASATITIPDTSGLSADEYYYIEDDNDGETFKIISVDSGTQLTADLENDYELGASINSPGRTAIGRVYAKVGNVISVSPWPAFNPTGEAYKINFDTYRVKELNNINTDTGPVFEVVCDHITNDLIDDVFLMDGRGTVGYSTAGFGTALDTTAHIDTLMDELMDQAQDFTKGDLKRFTYSEGTVSVTNGDATVTGHNVNWTNISPGSTFVVEGDSTQYTVAYLTATDDVESTTCTSLELTGNCGTTLTYAKYSIISKGIQTYADKVTLAQTYNGKNYIKGQVALVVNDGNVCAGAVIKIIGDTNEYIVETVYRYGLSYYIRLNQAVTRSSDSNLNIIITRDEREISFNDETILSCLQKISDIWSESKQLVWFEVNEDKTVDIVRKPIADDRDPTSDLVVRYRENMNSIARRYREEEFGNRVYPKGATSNWVNAESGVSSTIISRDLLEYDSLTGGGFTEGNTLTEVNGTDIIGDGDLSTAGLGDWGVTGDVTLDDANDQVDFVFAAGSLNGTLFQTAVNRASAGSNSTVYQVKFTVTVNTVPDGDFVLTLDNFPSASLTIWQSPWAAGTYAFGFTSAANANTQNFTITATETTSTQGDFIIDDVSCREATGKTCTIFGDTNAYGGTNIGRALVKNVLYGDFADADEIVEEETGYTATITDVIKENTKTRFGVKHPYYFRVGDPVQILRHPETVTVTIATANTITFAAATQYVRYYDADAAGFTDHDGHSTSAADNDVFLPPHNVADTVGDITYFGCGNTFAEVAIRVSTLGDGDWTNVWEYYDGSSWRNLTFRVQPMETFIQHTDLYLTSVGVYINRFKVPSNWATVAVNGTTAYWIRCRNTAITTRTTSPLAGRTWHGTYYDDQFRSGFVFISSGEGVGQTRAISDNTSATITTTREWDTIPFGATAKFAQRVMNTQIVGFKQQSYRTATSVANIILGENGASAVDHAYYGGVLEVTDGLDKGRTYELWRSYDDATALRLYANSILDGDGIKRFNVVGGHRMVKEYQTGTTFGGGGDGACTIAITDTNTLYDNMWNEGNVIITSGAEASDHYTINTSTYVANTLTLTLYETTWSGTPSSNDGVLLWRETHLPLTVAEMDFTPEEGDECILLMKELGNLTIGKHFDKRVQIVAGGRSYVWIATSDASTFTVNDRVFIGTKSITSDLIFGLRRGDQSQGQMATIKSKSTTGEITIQGSHDGAALNYLVDSTKNFEHMGIDDTWILENSTTANEDSVSSVDADQVTPDAAIAFNNGNLYKIYKAVTRIDFSDDVINEEILDTSPQPHDHIELLTIQNALSIVDYKKPVDLHYSAAEINDPKWLDTYANEYLTDAATLVPDYDISFTNLYEEDPELYKYFKYEVGDTIRMVDDMLDIDTSDIRIVSKQYDPFNPYDAQVEISAYKPKRRDRVLRRLAYYENILGSLQKEDAKYRCVFWGSQCRNKNRPNAFCHIAESKMDGIHTREGEIISRTFCSSYTSIEAVGLGTDDAYTTAKEASGATVQNTAWDSDTTTAYTIVTSDTTLSKDTKVLITKVYDNTAGSEVERTDGDVRILRYDDDTPMPTDTETRTGCKVLFRIASALTNIRIDAIVLLVGKK